MYAIYIYGRNFLKEWLPVEWYWIYFQHLFAMILQWILPVSKRAGKNTNFCQVQTKNHSFLAVPTLFQSNISLSRAHIAHHTRLAHYWYHFFLLLQLAKSTKGAELIECAISKGDFFKESDLVLGQPSWNADWDPEDTYTSVIRVLHTYKHECNQCDRRRSWDTYIHTYNTNIYIYIYVLSGAFLIS